jgi:hypothetical protein
MDRRTTSSNSGIKQEVSMTLTILDPRSGEKVTLWVEDTPVVRQPTPATVTTHPRFAAKKSR